MQPHIIFPKQTVTVPTIVSKSFPELITPPISPTSKRAKWIDNKLKSLLDPAQLSTQPDFWPERTLVFETIESVDSFYNALKEIGQYRFLLSELGEKIDPDNDYYLLDAKTGEKKTTALSTHLYFSMVNRTSLQKIYDCWKIFKKDNKAKLPTGFAPLRAIFKQLKNVRFWDTEDRLRVSGLREDLLERIENGEESIPIEIELWFHPYVDARKSIEEKAIAALQKINGKITRRCVIKEIGYHALLGEINRLNIQDLLDGKFDNVDLVKCDSVMFFRPVGQCQVSLINREMELELPSSHYPIAEETPPPVVALLDGYPIANHDALKHRLIIEDPMEFSDRYQLGENVHGTSMASLILHGDKNDKEAPLSRKIILCPIMAPDKKDTYNKFRPEKIPEDELPLDLIHTTVRRLLVSTKENPAIAPQVKIINISIGDHHRLFDNCMSPWARLLDWLSYTLNVLFVVSAGNHADDIELDITTADFDKLSPEEREHLVLQALQKAASIKRLRSPAEAINVLSVGALHHDSCDNFVIGHRINPFVSAGMPSPLNPLAWGNRRSIKPEILMPGGRQTYTNNSRLFDKKNVVLRAHISAHPPGLLAATPGTVPGKINAYAHSTGTSNATAIATRKLAQLYETLIDLSFAPRGEQLDKVTEAVLLKALLCHGAEPNGASEKIEKVIRGNEMEKRFKANVARFFGYGAVDTQRLFVCEDYQATLLRSGTIKDGEQHRFQLPLPPSLASKVVARRLIITLAWFSPVTAQRSYYREAECWFGVVGNAFESVLGTDQRHYDGNMIKKGTLQHEIFFSDKRAGVFTADSILEIDIHCKIKNEEFKALPIRFGLVVTLDTEDISIPIYSEVKQGIDALVGQRSEVIIDGV